MIIYLDIIFLYNFLIDWMILWAVAYLLKLRPRWYRLSTGAGIGALYTLFIFFPPLSGFFTFFSKFCLSALIILSVFGYHRLRVFMNRLLMFYLVSFVLGGGLLGLSYLLKSENEILSGIVVTHSSGFGTPVTWVFMLIGFPVIWFLSSKGVRELKQSEKKYSLLGEVEVLLGEKRVTCIGMLDTGNQLYEPISRIPVMIMELDLFREIIPEKLYHAVKDQKDLSSDLSFMQVDEPWLKRIRVIPYRSVSRGMDLLLAIKPDTVNITMPEGQFCEQRVLVGLNALSLSSEGKYKAIIHPDLIQEGKESLNQEQTMEKEAM